MQTNLPGGGANVNAFAISGTNLVVAASGGVFLSTNSGTSWTAVDSGLVGTFVSSDEEPSLRLSRIRSRGVCRLEKAFIF